jgi:hypothetical protein
LAQHVRRVYIVLLNAAADSETELSRLCGVGIKNNPALEKAIDLLCPDIKKS